MLLAHSLMSWNQLSFALLFQFELFKSSKRWQLSSGSEKLAKKKVSNGMRLFDMRDVGYITSVSQILINNVIYIYRISYILCSQRPKYRKIDLKMSTPSCTRHAQVLGCNGRLKKDRQQWNKQRCSNVDLKVKSN